MPAIRLPPRRPPATGALALCLAIWLAACAASAAEQAKPASRLPKIRVAAGGRTLQTADGKPFVPMGVNYFRPGTGWAPKLWKQFDPEATRRDFARMKELGVNCVRVFLTYGSLFNQPDALDAGGLAKLDQMLEIAEAAGIYLHPTGPDHWEGLPRWASGDRIADDRDLDALENFWRLLAKHYRGRDAMFAYDLLNEPQVGWESGAMRAKWNRYLEARYGSAAKAAEAWQVPPEGIAWGNQPPPPPKEAPGSRQLLDYQHFREEIADAWTRRQADAIRSADPGALVTVGLIQWSVPALLPGVQHYAAFRPSRQARWLDFMEIHFYPLAQGFYEYRGAEDEGRNLAYLESVVREVAAPGKPVLVAEFGWYGGGKLTIDNGVHPAAGEDAQARWCRRAVETTEGLATGWLNWGFYDHPEARDVTQLTGLLTVDGKPKAWAREFQTLARRLAAGPMAALQPGPRPALDWDRCLVSLGAGREFRAEYEKAFSDAKKSSPPAGPAFQVSPEERRKIEAAIPAKAFAVPAKPRKLLIFNLNVGYPGHRSIAHAELAFTLMGRKTGAFDVVASRDPSVFAPASLGQFDAVLLNNTVGNLFQDPALRRSLIEFVERGKGLMGVHGTTVAFTHWPGAKEDWPEFGLMLGARGANHRDSDERVFIKLDDPGHPINQPFGGQGFEYRDEFFRVHEPYSRARLRVLMSIDVQKTDLSRGGAARGKAERADNDYALAWVRSHGRGRVFYSTIAHNPYVFWDSKMLSFYLAAAQFALGDLPGPTAPSP